MEEITWARYDHNDYVVVFGEERIWADGFEHLGFVSRLKYCPDTSDFDVIRRKSEVERIARERGANIIARPKKKTRKKGLQGNLFFLHRRD